jgi:hypothetical protein
MNTPRNHSPIYDVSLKSHIAQIVLLSPTLRKVFGRYALRHVYAQILVNPKPIAFLLILRLGTNKDAVYVWYVLYFLTMVPSEVFEDKRIHDNVRCHIPIIEGKTIAETIRICEHVINMTFNMNTVPSPAQYM